VTNLKIYSGRLQGVGFRTKGWRGGRKRKRTRVGGGGRTVINATHFVYVTLLPGWEKIWNGERRGKKNWVDKEGMVWFL